MKTKKEKQESTLIQLYQLAMDRAGTLKGLKGRARYSKECERSCALQVERIRCSDLSEDQLLSRLAEVTK